MIKDRLFKTLEHIKYGSISVTTPEGTKHEFVGTEDGIAANITIHDWQAISSFALKGDIGLTEAYRDNLWDTDDLTNLLICALQNEQSLGGFMYGNFFARLIASIKYFFQRNSLKGSKRNIHAHYDLGNDFFKLWLDETMSYSSGIFKNANESLKQIQHNKYDRILDRINLDSGKLLEIGCGWGGFAERAIGKNDYDLKGITISNQQYEYSKQRLDNKANIVLEDYRHQQGKYDGIVSIEMFEAVGEKFWPTYFSKVKSLLNDKGKAVIQTITIGEEHFKNYRKKGDMIRSFIFPGGMLPSPTRFNQEAAKAGLKITDNFAFGKDYAATLKSWLHNFDQKINAIKALGFDDAFIKIWRFYLAFCIAGFTTGRTDVMQLQLEHI